MMVAEQLKKNGFFNANGGDFFLGELMASVPHSANAAYYARIVKQKAIARELLDACNQTMRDVYSNEYTSEELVERASERAFNVSMERGTTEVGTIGEAAKEVLERIDRRMVGTVGLSSGYPALDKLIDGFQDGHFVVIGARPSMGKTAIALNMADHISMTERAPVHFVSLEMGKVELAERLMVSRAGVANIKLRQPDSMSDLERERIYTTYGKIRDTEFRVDDTSARTVEQIVQSARRLKVKRGIRMIFVDYLQLIVPERDSRGSREEHVSRVSQRLKALARELQVPIVCLSQLNRAAEKRTDNRPLMSDLRESGSIEQDADIVLLMHRPEYYDAAERPGYAELIVGKNRNGPTGSVDLTFYSDTMTFREALPDFGPAVEPDPPGPFPGDIELPKLKGAGEESW